jgi:RNA polymerase sigma-70 factor, ECF subfamily
MQNNKKHQNLKNDFHKVYHEYSDSLFRFSFYRLSDREKAKDVVQDTFVKYWEYVITDSNEEVKNVKSFLYRIAINAITDQYRKKKNVSLDALSEEGFDPADSEIHNKVLRSLDSQRALELVLKLDESIRDIVLMRYVDELSVKEISEILDERENTISVKLHRAVKDLQKLFENNEK